MSYPRYPLQCGPVTIQILSKDLMATYCETNPHLVISIREPGSEKVVLPDYPLSRKGTLFLEFQDWDIERKHPADGAPIKGSDGKVKGHVVIFKEEHAKMILSFINNYPDVKAIIINCPGGVSRSSGVGAALSRIYCQNDNIFFQRFIPNMGVYRTLLNEYYAQKERLEQV